MDTTRAAKYPFLRESAEFVQEQGVTLEELICSDSYAPARARGKQRIIDALERNEVSYTSLIKPYECLIEVASYPYARMIVSQLGDRFLTKRYALSEAVRMNNLLSKEDHATLVMVSSELGVDSTPDADGKIHMKFPDFLMLSSRLKSLDWKLINSDIKAGIVTLPQDKFSRLMQNALQDKIESELPMMAPEELRPYLQADVDEISTVLMETKKRYSPTHGEGMKTEFLPPCIVHIMDMSRQGMNLAHSARFSLVTFLHALGLGYEDIIKVFAESPDFDESKSEYQIKHITGELTGTDGYTAPECKTMKTNGLCFGADDLCNSEACNHPLSYYRIKSRGGRPPQKQRFAALCGRRTPDRILRSGCKRSPPRPPPSFRRGSRGPFRSRHPGGC